MRTCVSIVSAMQRPEKGLRVLGAGVTGCEQPAWLLRIDPPPPSKGQLSSYSRLISSKKLREYFFYSMCVSILFEFMSVYHIPYGVLEEGTRFP